jgi:ABC-2 type transport system permease protein
MWLTRDFRAFVTYYVSEGVLAVSSVVGTLMLAERFNGIGAWTKPQMIFMLGYAITAMGILDLFFNYNVAYISRRIGRGQLDHVLIQPQPIWMALLTDGFAPLAGSSMVLPGVVLLVWAQKLSPIQLSPAWLGLFLVNLISSSAIAMSFSYILGSLAFWSPRGAEEISSPTMRALETLKSFPLDGLSMTLRIGLLSAVPAGLVAWLPSRALLGLPGYAHSVIITPLVALAFVFAAWTTFKLGMEHYGRTGSQRYLSNGHRR